MKKMRFATLLLAFGVAACQEASTSPPAAGTPPPAGAAAPSAADLRQLYTDKTWFWADGSGYFGPTGSFLALTGSGDKINHAKGFWWVTDHGEMCFDATWHAKDSAGAAVTCFDHRRAGEAWYQRKEPSGLWYIFKSDPPQPEDEVAKLKPGDQIGAAKTAFGISQP
jgi:hypothetical protein